MNSKLSCKTENVNSVVLYFGLRFIVLYCGFFIVAYAVFGLYGFRQGIPEGHELIKGHKLIIL